MTKELRKMLEFGKSMDEILNYWEKKGYSDEEIQILEVGLVEALHKDD